MTSTQRASAQEQPRHARTLPAIRVVPRPDDLLSETRPVPLAAVEAADSAIRDLAEQFGVRYEVPVRMLVAALTAARPHLAETVTVEVPAGPEQAYSMEELAKASGLPWESIRGAIAKGHLPAQRRTRKYVVAAGAWSDWLRGQ